MFHSVSNPPAVGMPTYALILALASTVALAICGPLQGFTFAWDGVLPLIWFVPLLLAAHIYYRVRGDEPRITAITGAFGLILWLGFVDCFLAYVALAVGSPFADVQLAAISGIGGFDHKEFAAFVGSLPPLEAVLEWAYRLTVPLVMLTIIILTITGQIERLTRMMGQYAILLTATLGISALFPARGPFLVDPLSETIRAQFPPGAGDYYRTIFEAIREDRLRVFSVDAMEGVVVFPSFHTIMALLIAHALAKTYGLVLLSRIYAGLVMASTIPFGGHYLADIEVSVVLFVLVAVLTRRGEHGVSATGAAVDLGPDMPFALSNSGRDVALTTTARSWEGPDRPG